MRQTHLCQNPQEKKKKKSKIPTSDPELNIVKRQHSQIYYDQKAIHTKQIIATEWRIIQVSLTNKPTKSNSNCFVLLIWKENMNMLTSTEYNHVYMPL